MSDTAAKPAEKKQALDGTRLNAFGMLPEDLTLVMDKSHPLYDERVHAPIVEEMVLSVLAFGVIEPVIAKKEGDKALVVAGRQRVKWTLEANRRRKKDGLPPIKVPVMLRRGEDGDLLGVTLAENGCRLELDPVMEARKAQRYIDLGHSEEEAALACGLDHQTLKVRLRLLDAAPEVQKAVQAGTITQTKAVQLAKKPVEEQKAAAAAPKKARAKKLSKVRLKETVRAIVNRHADLPVKVKGILAWLVNDIDGPALAEILGVDLVGAKKDGKKKAKAKK